MNENRALKAKNATLEQKQELELEPYDPDEVFNHINEGESAVMANLRVEIEGLRKGRSAFHDNAAPRLRKKKIK